MPDITIKLANTTDEKKKALIEKLSTTAAEVTEIPADKFIVWVEEYDQNNIGVGGKQLSEIMKGN